MHLLVNYELSLDVFKLRQSNLVLVLPVISSCDLLQDCKRVLRREIRNEVKRSFFDIEDNKQKYEHLQRNNDEDECDSVLEPIKY